MKPTRPRAPGALLLLALLTSNAAEASWLENTAPPAGPAYFQVLTTNRQVLLRYKSGESVSRTVAFFVRTGEPIREIADLTNAWLIDRVRTAGGSTTYVPDQNGTYYAAAIAYTTADALRQRYVLFVSDTSAVVDWVPARPLAWLAPAASVSNPAPSNAAAGTAQPPASAASASNVVPKPAEAPPVVRPTPPPAPLPVTVAMAWPTNFFEPLLTAVAPQTNEGLKLSAHEFLSALTKLLAERRSNEAPVPERDRYFSRDPAGPELEELAACSRELRDVYGALARHRREALAVSEAEVYPMLAAYANAVIRMEQALVRIMQRGIKLAEVERLQADFTELNRELLELWRRVDSKLKEALLGPTGAGP